ncbi:MAG: PIG-L deacetylase family protein [Bacillota bacterium]
MFDWKRVLVLAPHTDDAELGCGGTIARLIEEGVEIFIAVFSTAEKSLPPGVPPGTLREEFLKAMETMEVPPSNLLVFDFEVRRLNYYRQEVLEKIVQIKKQVSPDAVFLPASTDLHQDHQVIFQEGMRAFKNTTVLGYELPWNHLSFEASFLIELATRHLEKKWQAMLCYQTQFMLRRPYFAKSFIESLARMRGVQVDVEYAEAFQALRVLSRMKNK